MGVCACVCMCLGVCVGGGGGGGGRSRSAKGRRVYKIGIGSSIEYRYFLRKYSRLPNLWVLVTIADFCAKAAVYWNKDESR